MDVTGTGKHRSTLPTVDDLPLQNISAPIDAGLHQLTEDHVHAKGIHTERMTGELIAAATTIADEGAAVKLFISKTYCCTLYIL